MQHSDLKQLRKDYAKKTGRIIKRNTELDETTIRKFAIELEKYVFNAAKNLAKSEGELIFDDMKNYTSKFVKYYEGTFRPILININPKSYVGNVDLIKSIGAGTIEPSRLVKLSVESPQSLHYSKHSEYFKRIEQQEDILFNKNLEFSSDERCKKCKSNKCVMTQAQLRSADEPMTTLVSCLSCGNRWQY